MGRRWLFTVSRISESGLFLAALFVTNYWVMFVLMAVLGLSAAGMFNVGFVYISEWFPRKNQTVLHMIIAGEVAMGYIGYTMYHWFISNDTMDV